MKTGNVCACMKFGSYGTLLKYLKFKIVYLEDRDVSNLNELKR